MGEQLLGVSKELIVGLINQSATLEAANRVFYASIITASVSIVVCIITIYFNYRQSIRVKHKEYVDEYYKHILQKRIMAYELLESFVASIKLSVLDDSGKPYHLIFSREELYEDSFKLLLNLTSQALWFNKDTFDITRELNYIFFRADTTEKTIIDYGKENYTNVAELRHKLENMIARDMLSLHDIENFLKEQRKSKSGYTQVEHLINPPKKD